MFEFFLSIKVSFWLVGAVRMPRRCAATLPLFGKRQPHAQLPFLSSWRRGVEDGLEAIDTCLGSLESKISLEELSQRTRLCSSSE